MAMPATIDKLSIRKHGTNEKLDRRIKLTTDDKEAIRTQYFNAHEGERPTMTSLAAKYNVDRRLIQFILFPEREDLQKKQASLRQKDGRYYNKEKGRKNMQEYRDYKRKLVKDGKLKSS
ncbi:hypothetical protein JUJ52_02905 [Virgibacillus sp. AGTR]|uniref:hypothetical protein n=1 Tax=Virgibacillus sp. AGTR TaxID=2812055 RepID=UPI001D16257E|nr:hypothetical protein [Virgibacillus sp. AGTR]MCC2248906.1 hypothetical protein [Virgibacillus sp. AGTR]